MSMPRDPRTDADQVHHELIALHWLSHGKGATATEIVDALEIRAIAIPVAVVWGILLDLVEHGWATDTGATRTGRTVYVPTEGAEFARP